MNTQTRTARWRELAAFVLVALILAVPSIWFLSAIPPLWRDVDAYIQTTSPPGPSTILLQAPLYSFAARVPLYVRYRFVTPDADAKTFADFFVSPRLTDSGVFSLLLLQHGALMAAQLGLVCAVVKRASVRLLIPNCLSGIRCSTRSRIVSGRRR